MLPAASAPDAATPTLIAAAQTPTAPGSSLVYGCGNAGHGRDVKDGTGAPEAVSVIEDVAGTLGLAAHAVLDGAGRAVSLCLPIDTEAHVAADGRLYLIDLARLLPPVPPPAGDRANSYLYRHFRPEFLRRHHLSLSSDAFSSFAASDEPNDAGGLARAQLRALLTTHTAPPECSARGVRAAAARGCSRGGRCA
jgi:hypothetical protein